MYKLIKVQIYFMVAFIAFYATYAYASSNARLESGGEGTSAISGWTISNVHYGLAENSPNIASVEFDLDKPASMVRAGFNSLDTAVSNCENPSGTHWVCKFELQMPILAAAELRIVSTD